MHAMRASRALLLGLVCLALGCSNKPPEETSLAQTTSPVVEGWTETGALAETRKYHAGVVLSSSKVLVTGGYNSSGFLSSASLYDPATGVWAAAAPMQEARQAHSATLLHSGKVLVAGGESATGRLASAAIYSPDTNSWVAAGSFASGVARDFMTATLLPSGRVLVTGGGNSAGAHARVDVYDPVSGTWSVGPNLGTARRNHTATILPSGQVLIVGGIGSGSLATAEVYTPSTHTWAATGSLATARYDHTAALLPSGKVLVMGGRNNSGLLATAEEYDPSTGLWSAAGAMGTARTLHSATMLNTGKVLVAGGMSGSAATTALASAEVYDPATRQWTATTSMVNARYGQVAVALGQEKVLVVGGLGANGASQKTAEVYAYDVCAGVTCTSPSGPCYEATGTCSNGVCGYTPKAVGASCDDGNACTGADACDGAGVCAGSATRCESPPGQCYESSGTCSNGTCSYTYKAAGESCDDGDACTLGETCNGTGGCMGTPVSCNSPPGPCHETAGTCNAGACAYTPKAAGIACNDGNAGTVNDTCNGAGACTGVPACTTPPNACLDSPGTYSNGACTYPTKAAGTLCDDGNACTTSDVCDGTGTCGGTVLSCNTPPGQCYQAAGTCSNGICSYAPKATSTSCDDSDACTTGDVCDSAGTCGGTAMSCSISGARYCSGNTIRQSSGTGICSGGVCGVNDIFIATCPSSISPPYCGADGVYQTFQAGCLNAACRSYEQLIQACSPVDHYFCSGNNVMKTTTGVCANGGCTGTTTVTVTTCVGGQICSNGACVDTGARWIRAWECDNGYIACRTSDCNNFYPDRACSPVGAACPYSTGSVKHQWLCQ
ncbi:hypothetical protein HPP05_10045 [Corallococcus exiguus]|uniref:Kelch repeat-containing protein n=1 Tax=Corallococcus exiguus TaxID=83462 RepID=UPI0014946064|nr:kelch repeat-containing protein [Corallococcus exiguus]NPC70084.1 hypothetical protein [Corallococcus exiguus]